MLLQEGAVWRRRRPRWLAIEKVNAHSLWRASQKSFRWWASTECTEATLDMISRTYKVNPQPSPSQQNFMLLEVYNLKFILIACSLYSHFMPLQALFKVA
jgi:hypothetical protein